jgi:Uma2 family endonuclease
MSTSIQEPSATSATPPSDGLYEIINGKVVEKTMGVYEVHIVNLIDLFLGRFAFDHQLGYVESEMLFNFGVEGQPQRRPDVAFFSYQRWPKGRRFSSENALRVVPDLVVEVVSPTNSANEVEEKTVEYLEAGVRLVWVVYPTTSRIYVYDGSSTVRVITRTGELDGGDVLPEFRLALSNLFEDGPTND